MIITQNQQNFMKNIRKQKNNAIFNKKRMLRINQMEENHIESLSIHHYIEHFKESITNKNLVESSESILDIIETIEQLNSFLIIDDIYEKKRNYDYLIAN